MKKVLIYITAALAATGIQHPAEACSNVLVTRGASADGSCMISYAADSHQLFGELYYSPAADWPQGSMLKIYEWDTNAYMGEIPQVSHTYQTVGNMNEHQLIIAETTYGGREELCRQDGSIMDYGSLIYVALQRARTAREAIRVITELAAQYGYASEGESFSIADTEEVWVMDLIGKGQGHKGMVWVARRVPDGYICAHANQARISTFPLDDPENCLYAEDVISFARGKGWFDGKDEEFSFCDTYAPLDFSGMRACEARAWSAFNILCKGMFTYTDADGNEVTTPADHYLPYAMGRDAGLRFPLFVKPAEKIGVKAVADVMRDHYEGTPMDMTQDIGAGGNALPYRWRPMSFTVDGKKYCNERAIATQQTGFWFVAQARGWLPDCIGGIDWFGTDDAASSYLTPIYACTKEIPECFRVGNGDMLHYSATSSFWMNNRVANACYRMYNVMYPAVRAEIDAWENARIAETAQVDEAARALYDAGMALSSGKKGKRTGGHGKNPDPCAAVKDYLTEWSVNRAQEIFTRWVALEEFLLVKFMDGNVKSQDENGEFVTNGNGSIPDKIQHPEYTEFWKKAVAESHGDILEIR